MKSPWLACVLNIVFPGIGYIYVGRRVAFGVMLFVSSLILFGANFSGIDLSDIPGSVIVLGALSGVLTLIAFGYDGYKDAKEANQHLGHASGV